MTLLTMFSSPNFDQRDPAIALRHIVLHYTDMPGDLALKRLCDPAAKVSAHYLIEEDGRVFKLVDEAMRAWHAGKSYWRGVADMNSASIGIELVNPGHRNGYRSFPSAQIAAVKSVMRDIIARHNLSPAFAPLGHSDIAPERKEDPGEFFPWQELAKDGLGIWPVPRPEDYGHAEDEEVQKLLRAIGYECPLSGAYDRATRAALLAFQRRYEPDNLTGTPEQETIARVRALVRLSEAMPGASHPSGSLPPAA
jgi:N-acetylmuramoyl-L-alanine amidase